MQGDFICAKLIPIQPTLSQHAINAYGHMIEKFFIKRAALKQQNQTGGISAQFIGNNAACRSGSKDNKIKIQLFLHGLFHYILKWRAKPKPTQKSNFKHSLSAQQSPDVNRR